MAGEAGNLWAPQKERWTNRNRRLEKAEGLAVIPNPEGSGKRKQTRLRKGGRDTSSCSSCWRWCGFCSPRALGSCRERQRRGKR
jgi:hypothetical protein